VKEAMDLSKTDYGMNDKAIIRNLIGLELNKHIRLSYIILSL
jgi:hypothetical protein